MLHQVAHEGLPSRLYITVLKTSNIASGHDMAHNTQQEFSPGGKTTGFVYNPVFLEHTQSTHPENKERLVAILKGLEEFHLEERLVPVPARPAEERELLLVHTPAHLRRVQTISREGGGYFDPDTYANAFSYDAAVRAAGGLIDLTLSVIRGTLHNGFALIRPPGHHALPDRSMGFCIFNNVAVAARAALDRENLSRIAIIDFDVHHGNGTQAVFERDPHVLYVSSHQYPHYPGTGAAAETGSGEGSGATLNMPLPAGCGDDTLIRMYSEIAVPLLRKFQPELILVSAGFDGHWKDPLAQLNFTLKGIDTLVRRLVALANELCGGRIVFTLEGGYNPDVLKLAAVNTFFALLNEDEAHDPLGAPGVPEPDLHDLITRLKELHHLP